MKTLILGGLALAAALMPAVGYAATYAYVNTAGEVMTAEHATASEALLRSDLHVHSGVMLMDDSSDSAVIGDDVPGA